MVGVIAASHLIETLGLRQLGTVMHKDFPAVALIHDEVPKHPVSVYRGDGLGVFIGDSVRQRNGHPVRFYRA